MTNENDADNFAKIREGRAEILFPQNNEVFYNPVQEFNRDMSIASIKTWASIFRQETKTSWYKRVEKRIRTEKNLGAEETVIPKFTILEALAASGLRSIRYALEMQDELDWIMTNDMSEDAVKSIKRNAAHNGLSEERLRPNQGDACDVMYARRASTQKHFEVVDLDPYGTSIPFLDAAIQCVADGGLLCVTCTDLAVLAGNYPETCFAKYGGIPLNNSDFCHESALRILLNAIQTSAGRYRRYIVPMMSCSIDFYIRIFVRVFTSPAEMKKACTKTMMAFRCVGCKTFHTMPLGTVAYTTEKGGVRYAQGRLPGIGSHCDACGGAYQITGPMWGGPLHEKKFVSTLLEHLKQSEAQKLYNTHSRMLGMVSVISEELDTPFYYTYGGIASIVRCQTPPLIKFNSALLNAGFKVSSSHCHSNAFKTDAPPSVIWDIVRAWVKLTPVNMAKYPDGSPAKRILSSESSTDVSFETHSEANPPSRKIKLVRFEDHRGQNWGPKARAKKQRTDE